jgi:hypothetical protein
MRELLIVLLIAAAGYLAYDDFYKQRPALQQAQAQIQQINQNGTSVTGPVSAAPRSRPLYVPTNPPSRPSWFQKRLDESSAVLDDTHQHTQKGERASTPAP